MVEINDESHEVCNVGSQNFNAKVRFSDVCYDYSDAYILANGTITVPKLGTAVVLNNRKKCNI